MLWIVFFIYSIINVIFLIYVESGVSLAEGADSE